MKFPTAELLSNLTLDQGLRLQRPAKINDFMISLEIPTNNFRTKIATGKMFTLLCFFCKCTPNYTYIDLKRSLSNLISGKCKFDLRSMSKTSKLCQNVYHSTHFDVTRVFILLCGYSGPIGSIHNPHRCSIRCLVIYSEKLMTSSFLLVIFRSSRHRIRKLMAYLES